MNIMLQFYSIIKYAGGNRYVNNNLYIISPSMVKRIFSFNISLLGQNWNFDVMAQDRRKDRVRI